MKDEQQIRDTIKVYFDCMLESSAEKAHAAFHPNAKITGYIEENLREISVTDYANLVANQLPSPKEKGESPRCDILSIDIAGNTAVARVRDDWRGSTFLDTLSLIKIKDNWSIYNKLFHVEGPSD